MSSSAADGTISLRRLLNERVFPALAATTLLAVFTATSAAYFTLKTMIPPECADDARHAMFVIGLGTAAAAALAAGSTVLVAVFIDRHVTRPTERLTRWAEERCRTGEGPALPGFSLVAEIRQLASVFGRLFGLQAGRVREIRTLVGATRHDVTNHLANIGSNAQFVLEGRRDAATAAAKTLREVEAVIHILDVSADIARNYSHILGEPPTEIVVADLVHDCLDLLETAADDRGVALDADIPPRSLVATAHRHNLESVIRNLVGNALKYTPEGGRVMLSVSECADGLSVEVADTGIGISDEDKPHVFERGFRARSAGGAPGSGLGLAFVASVVALYGGSTEIRDNTPCGTVVTVRLAVPTSVPSRPSAVSLRSAVPPATGAGNPNRTVA